MPANLSDILRGEVVKQIARKLRVTPAAVYNWRQAGEIPPRRVLDVERITGIPRSVLSPKMYPPERSAA